MAFTKVTSTLADTLNQNTTGNAATATAKLKLQWGQNLIKFEGITMPGGVTLNGRQLVDDAKEEIQRLEEEVRLGYELPVLDMIG